MTLFCIENAALALFGIHNMDYETLDNIADAYIPVLAIIVFFASVFVDSGSQNRLKIIFFRLICLSILLGIAYGFMFLDLSYAIWPSLGLDYSTHTAVSLVLVLFLGLLISKLRLLWFFSLVVYFCLMLYQKYHSVADILSTALVLFITMALVFSPILIGTSARKLRRSKTMVAMFPFFQ